MIVRPEDADQIDEQTLRVKHAGDVAKRRFHQESAGGVFVTYGPGEQPGTTVLEWLEESFVVEPWREPVLVSIWHRITYVEAPA